MGFSIVWLYVRQKMRNMRVALFSRERNATNCSMVFEELASRVLGFGVFHNPESLVLNANAPASNGLRQAGSSNCKYPKKILPELSVAL